MSRAVIVTLLLIALSILHLSTSEQIEVDTTGKQIRTASGVDLSDPMTSFESVESILEKYVPDKDLQQVKRVLYGKGSQVDSVPQNLQDISDRENFEIKVETLSQNAFKESSRKPRVVRVGLIQNSIVLPTTAPVQDQKNALMARIGKMIDAAGQLGVNVLCLQEAWTMPFAFASREKYVKSGTNWVEFAEDAEEGESTQFLMQKAKEWNMVIVSPILERDTAHNDMLWNTAVVIGNNGNYIGKHRKNHIPSVQLFNEANYYREGNTGHPVFETAFGRIAVNICYGRHHPLNWMMFGLNGAEIVFNPSATVGALSEPMWSIEGRNAAIANSYFVASINRVGTEHFPNEFTAGDGGKAQKHFGHFYGSSYIAAPDASRTSSLSRLRDGLLAVDLDLNQVRQVRDSWMFAITGRHELYAKGLKKYVRHDFKPQIIRDPALQNQTLRALEESMKNQ